MKRSLDVSFALALLLLFLPLFILIAISIKATSRGPVLFRQKRNGAGRRPFDLVKFRSMYVHCPGEFVAQAVRGDPRVTPVGKWLRRSSFDELPQLFNVLRGDMSLIGPRPHAVEHDSSYVGTVKNYEDRWVTRPGLTGLAQVSGARGEIKGDEDIARRIRYDRAYVEQACLRLDAKILVMTIKEVVASRTAY